VVTEAYKSFTQLVRGTLKKFHLTQHINGARKVRAHLHQQRKLFFCGCNFSEGSKSLSIGKKSDFQSQILQTVRCPKGSDFTLSVQVGVHPGLKDYNQSLILAPESWEVGFYFVAMDKALYQAFI
jgi:hypothetical protein